MPLPTLRQLEYVVALADHGHFGDTARICGVSQPALSKQIREVEDLLGVPLFERSRPRVMVTEAGEELVRRARRLLCDARELVAVAEGWRGEQRGTIELGVIPTIAPYALPGLLAKLRQLFPEVSYSIHELKTDDLLDKLRSGAVDVGLLAQPFDAQGLTGPDLVVEPFVFVAPVGHRLCRRGALDPARLAGESLILMADGHCLRDQAIEVCSAAGPPPATSVAAGSISTLVRMVESGLGASLLPASALATEVREGQGIVARSFGKAPPGRTISLVWRASSPSATWFGDVGKVLRKHYLEMNATMPSVSGPKPRIRAV